MDLERNFLRSPRWTIVLVALHVTVPVAAYAQEEVLTSAFGNATDFNLFLTQVGAPKGVLKPERGSGAAGVGFELAFRVPGNRRCCAALGGSVGQIPGRS